MKAAVALVLLLSTCEAGGLPHWVDRCFAASMQMTAEGPAVVCKAGDHLCMGAGHIRLANAACEGRAAQWT